MDGGAWKAAVQGVAKVRRDLKTKEEERTLGSVLFPRRQRPLFVPFSQTRIPPWRDHPGLTYPEPDLVP